jgi:hypothetical protein
MTKMEDDNVRHLSIWISFDIRHSCFVIPRRHDRRGHAWITHTNLLCRLPARLLFERRQRPRPLARRRLCAIRPVCPDPQIGFDNRLLGDLQTVPRKRLTLHLFGHVAGVIVFAMTGKPQHEATTNCGGRPARARLTAPPITSRHAARSVPSSCNLRTVSNRPFHQIIARKFAVVRRRVRVMIICRDHHERHLFHRGNVHSFVKRTGLAFPLRRYT